MYNDATSYDSRSYFAGLTEGAKSATTVPASGARLDVAAFMAEAKSAGLSPASLARLEGLAPELTSPVARHLAIDTAKQGERLAAANATQRAILESPEARARPRAAARLLELNPSMSASDAKAVLRGIRPEAATSAPSTSEAPIRHELRAERRDADDTTRENRRAELAMAGARFRASRWGAGADKKAARSWNYATQIAAQNGFGLAAAARSIGLAF